MHNYSKFCLDVKVNMKKTDVKSGGAITDSALSSNQFVHEVKSKTFILRTATPEDAFSIHTLVADNPPLDPNSLYCNLLQCSHFADTSVVAESDGELVAFMTAYIKPSTTDELFVWQMAVAEQSRGHGLAGLMLENLVKRHEPRFIETTITDSNKASSAVFDKFIQSRSLNLTKSVLFDKHKHFAGKHDSEVLYRIGPISY